MNSIDEDETHWKVDFTRKAEKQAGHLPQSIYEILAVLKGELELEDPIQPEWYHYGKLTGKKVNTITVT